MSKIEQGTALYHYSVFLWHCKMRISVPLYWLYICRETEHPYTCQMRHMYFPLRFCNSPSPLVPFHSLYCSVSVNESFFISPRVIRKRQIRDRTAIASSFYFLTRFDHGSCRDRAVQVLHIYALYVRISYIHGIELCFALKLPIVFTVWNTWVNLIYISHLIYIYICSIHWYSIKFAAHGGSILFLGLRWSQAKLPTLHCTFQNKRYIVPMAW